MGHTPITLQINVAPSDHWHVRASLAHHMRTWGGQVDEVLFSVDTHRSHGPRGVGWDEGKSTLAALLHDMEARYPSVRVVDVDYSAIASTRVSEEFFAGREIPSKDCFGAPFYAYLYGLHMATHQLVLHLDADMLFGGGSQLWLREAVAALDSRSDVLVCAPLPGPPTADGVIPPKIAERHRRTQRYGSAPVPQQYSTPAYAFSHMSTRVFLLDRRRFASLVGSLRRMRLLRRGYPRGLGHPPFFPLETVLSRGMHRRNLVRLNMLGTDPGMWFVHPPARQPGLERELPRLIERVEQGDVPDQQRGDDQMNGSMFASPLEGTVAPAPRLLRRVGRRLLSSRRPPA